MVMPNELTYLADDLVNRVKRRRPIHLGFEPPPEALDRIILRGIRCQMFEGDPVVLREKLFDGTALVNRGIIHNEDQQGLGKALMELMQKLQKPGGRAACGPLPIEALRAHMQGAKQGRTLALPWGWHFDALALAKPAALDVGCIGKMRFIDREDFYRPLRLARANGGDDFCHPGFFFRPWEHSGGRFSRSVCRPSPRLAVGGEPSRH